MNERERSLKKVQMYNFAIIEATMFLDTHPNDRNALEYLKQNKRMLDNAKCDYVKRFGPLLATDVDNDTDSFEWVKGPWPWEGQCNVEL